MKKQKPWKERLAKWVVKTLLPNCHVAKNAPKGTKRIRKNATGNGSLI